MAKTLSRLKNHRKVAIAEWDEPDGYYIQLKQGWTFDPCDDDRVTICPTLREAQERVSMAQPYDGPYTD